MLLFAAIGGSVPDARPPLGHRPAPYGEDHETPCRHRRHGGCSPCSPRPIVVLKEVSKTSTFWILFATFFICGLSTNGLMQTHFVTLCGDFGILPVAAASVLA
jgi:hypothetical protein